METWTLLHIQHEYSKFVTMREFNNLETSDDVDYCMNILSCVPDIDIGVAKMEILNHVGYNEETGWFEAEPGENWDYNTLDEVLFKCIGKELYHE